MGDSSVVNQIFVQADPLAKEQNLEIVDISYRKEAGNWVLRVLIDKESGVSLDDCTNFSQALERLLDVSLEISNQYLLEVSSAGLDRPLKTDLDFKRFTGRMINVHTYAPVNGRRQFKGVLKGLEKGQVVLEDSGKKLELPRELVAKANLEFEL